MARRTTDRQMEEWSSTLPDTFLLCRDIGHTWRPYRAWWNADERCYSRILQCGRCKTERLQDLSQSGEVLSGHYNYAEGYTAPKGAGRLGQEGRDGLRLESILRLVGKDEVEAASPKRKLKSVG